MHSHTHNSNLECKVLRYMKDEISEQYSELLKSPLWKIKRERIMERDGHKCVNCGSSSSLVVHHKQYHFFKKRNELANPWEYDDKYLITLCSTCHQSGHEIFDIPVKIVEFK